MSKHSEQFSTRQLKASEQIKRALAEIFQRENFLHEELIDIPVTVTEVRLSPDLKVANVYVLPLTGKGIDKERFLQNLKEIVPGLRKILTKKIQFKYSPELIFRFDDSFDMVQKIDQLLKSTLPASVEEDNDSDQE